MWSKRIRTSYVPGKINPIECVDFRRFNLSLWFVRGSLLMILAGLSIQTGCQSPYHADRAALTGGVLGAGIGAIVADATGNNALGGAAIGAATGAIAGGVVGQSMDEQEARNRRMIEAHLGQQVSAGSVTIPDVITMTNSNVDDELIVNHIRGNGVAAPLTTNDLITLQQAGVSSRVISVMQSPPPPKTVVVKEQPVIVRERSPVIVREHHWGPSCRPRYYHRPPPRSHAHLHIGL